MGIRIVVLTRGMYFCSPVALSTATLLHNGIENFLVVTGGIGDCFSIAECSLCGRSTPLSQITRAMLAGVGSGAGVCAVTPRKICLRGGSFVSSSGSSVYTSHLCNIPSQIDEGGIKVA